jgi:hypothetical protein
VASRGRRLVSLLDRRHGLNPGRLGLARPPLPAGPGGRLGHGGGRQGTPRSLPDLRLGLKGFLGEAPKSPWANPPEKSPLRTAGWLRRQALASGPPDGPLRITPLDSGVRPGRGGCAGSSTCPLPGTPLSRHGLPLPDHDERVNVPL